MFGYKAIAVTFDLACLLVGTAVGVWTIGLLVGAAKGVTG